MKSYVLHVLQVAIGRIILCAVILAASAAIMILLASLKEPPAQALISERAIPVEVKEISPENVPVTITAYGEARSLDVVQLAAEVAGKIVEVHPRLEKGEIIPAGELLFRIDQTDYKSGVEQAESQVRQTQATIERLHKQYGMDKERLETLKRTRELAQTDFSRVRELLQQDEVGTQAGVDAAEMRFNQADDAHDQLAQLVDLYPTRITEAESALAAATAQHDMASNALARTEVRAPFAARLKDVRLEVGQYARPGEPVLVLADDSLLEISVPLDSRDASRWLRFQAAPKSGGESWFGALEPVRCRIRWTEEPADHFWEGTLDRVERLDQQTRTVTVAVRVTHEEAVAEGAGLPLVEGMFCAVDIPGVEMQQVFRLPRWAVSFENEVYIAADDHLQVRKVELVRTQGEETFVKEGLKPGDKVIVTRLVNPLPNARLEVSAPGKAESDS